MFELDLQKESQKAWKLREEGKILEALAIWQKLYYEYIEAGNWERVMSTLIDITICWKIKGEISEERTFFEAAITTLNHIKYLSEKEHIPLRSDFDYHLAGIQTSLGVYEQAIVSYEHYLSTTKSPEEEANILAHVGYAKANHGQKEEGIATLRKALGMFENSQAKNEFQGKDVFRIWKLGAQLKLADVLALSDSRSDKDEAKQLAKSAFEEAKEKGLGARQKQAKALLEKIQ